MGSQESLMQAGPISRFLEEDHRRLERLLDSAVSEHRVVDWDAYDRFRAGLLRHIGMEEKVLLPTLQRLRGGTPYPQASKLRLDHGALATLLMPTPTPAILRAIRAILSAHNRLEEGPDGLYAAGDHVDSVEADSLLARLRAVPPVTVAPLADSPVVMRTVRASMQRAGYDPSDYETEENATFL